MAAVGKGSRRSADGLAGKATKSAGSKAKVSAGTIAAKKKPIAQRNKGAASKVVQDSSIFSDSRWTVCFGELQRPTKRGRKPKETEHLFRMVGEKLPYSALKDVRTHVGAQLNLPGKKATGVYVAHDSMGCPRYIGRGNIFDRLEARKKAQQLELEYFSFYVVADKKHEREVETLLIRSAGFLLQFNTQKKRLGIGPGNIMDYEPGTVFYERHYKKGKKPAAKKS